MSPRRHSPIGRPARLAAVFGSGPRSKIAPHTLDIHGWRVALAAWVVMIAACQLDRDGKAPVTGPDSSDPIGSTDPDEGSPDATGAFPTSDPNAVKDGSVPGLVVGRSRVDAADDAMDATGSDSIEDAGLDSSNAFVDAEAGTPCARLLRCCPSLELILPLSLACVATAMQDGGDSACETALSSLADAGVCP